MRRRDFIAGLGGAAALPLAAFAQQRALPVIGYLSALTESSSRTYSAAFRQGLGEQGYVEGRNVEILYRWADTQYDRLPGMAADLLGHRVAVIFANANAADFATGTTATIPIVFMVANDPVKSGLVASLNRPGGNATGVSVLVRELTAKRLELLHEIAPAVTSIALLVDPTRPMVEAEIREAEIAAAVLGVRLVTLKASTPSEIEAAFAMLAGLRIGALLAGTDPLFFVQRDQLAALAARHAVPAIYQSREFVDAGGLMSYAANWSDGYRLAGTYVGRILKGEKPADLPVQQATRIEMVLNLKTAKALGIEVPTATLLRATEVIE